MTNAVLKFTWLCSASEYGVLVRRYLAVLHSLVSADMDFTQLEAFLTSQMKKRQVHMYWLGESNCACYSTCVSISYSCAMVALGV